MSRKVRFTRIVSRTHSMAQELGDLNFCRYYPESPTWTPPVNLYRYPDRFVVCLELAGVEKKDIQLQAEPKKLVIRGVRPSPTPSTSESDTPPAQTLALEIENGVFEREIRFPLKVDTQQVSARQENGLLWITLPHQTT